MPLRLTSRKPTVALSSHLCRAHDHWTDGDERDYSRFIAAIGDSACTHGRSAACTACANPFHAHRPGRHLFPLRLRRPRLRPALLFRLEARAAVRLRQRRELRGRRPRYPLHVPAATPSPSAPLCRAAVESGYAIWDTLRDDVSSATFRIHPDLEEPMPPDLYSPAIDAKSIRPGT